MESIEKAQKQLTTTTGGVETCHCMPAACWRMATKDYGRFRRTAQRALSG